MTTQKEDQTTYPKSSKPKDVYLEKHGDVVKQQEVMNAIAAVGMRKSIQHSYKRIAGLMNTLGWVKEKKTWVERGMSQSAEWYLKSLQEDIDYYEMQVKLYRMIIERKKKR